MSLLVFAFSVTALLYASIGFGGGSTYVALLAASEMDYQLVPVLGLACNIIVATGGAVRFYLARKIPRNAIYILAISIPAAFLGGALPVDEKIFYLSLGLSLALAGSFLMLLPANYQPGSKLVRSRGVAVASGAVIGFVSGLVGIGGGIFLAPLLHLTGWDSPRRIAGTSTVFILWNSVSGLIGQLVKSEAQIVSEAMTYWPLALAVLVGGSIGTRLGLQGLPEQRLRQGTGLLVLIVAIRLLFEGVQRSFGSS